MNIDPATSTALGRSTVWWRSIECLYPTLTAAATVLRVAFELDATLQANPAVRTLLERVCDLERRAAASAEDDHSPRPRFVVCEGLDGSGKSTLAKRLAAALKGGRVLATPPVSLAHDGLREVFDSPSFKGPVARAYYMCSNYIAVAEMCAAAAAAAEAGAPPPIFVVDRFWSTTCSCKIGYDSRHPPTRPLGSALVHARHR